MTRCEYCGLLLDSECPNPVEHERLNAMNETWWRELAERPMRREQA